MRVAETYVSFQGTGFLAGTRQFFLRMAGCSVPCPIRKVCDEPQALSHDAGEERAVDDVLAEVSASGCSWIHFSGGEPLEHDDAIRMVVGRGWMVQVQTSGLLEFPRVGPFPQWVTCSPKAPADKLKLAFCHELVVVAAPWVKPEHLNGFASRYSAHRYVMPLWGETPERCVQLIDGARDEWRLAIQAHKYWNLK